MQTLSSRFQFFYTAQSSLGYSIGNLAQGMANNGMSDEQRRTLPAGSPEYHMRVLGSQIQVAGWTVYSMLIWALKLSMLTFYTRLTSGLGRPFRIRINIGFALVLSTFVAALLSIFTACRPFGRYWQINPNPGSKQREMTRNPCSVSPLTFFFVSRLLSGRRVKTHHLGIICRQCVDRYLPYHDSPSNAVAIDPKNT